MSLFPPLAFFFPVLLLLTYKPEIGKQWRHVPQDIKLTHRYTHAHPQTDTCIHISAYISMDTHSRSEYSRISRVGQHVPEHIRDTQPVEI